MRLKNKKNSSDSWNEIWGSYDRKSFEYQIAVEEHSVRWQRIQQIILNKYGSFSGIECIEIGGGSGHYSMLFAKRGARVTILDYSENALEFCRRIFKEQRIPPTQVKCLLMNALKIDEHCFGKYDVSMSFGVAEHFQGQNRKLIVKNHIMVLKKGGVAFISAPHKGCIPFTVYQFLMKFVGKRNIVEAYPFTRSEFLNIIRELNIKEYSFIGSSIYETYNPISFYQRKKGLVRDISCLRKEKGSILDQYMSRELTLVGINGERLDQ